MTSPAAANPLAGRADQGSPFDLLVRNGTVIDGTRAPRFDADVGVRDARIVFIGRVDDASAGAARQTVDATARIVAPGFIDCHTHDDTALLTDPQMTPKVSQGVTTEVTGNCGFSPFPINPEHLQLHLDLLAGIGDDAMALTWTDLDGYRAAAESRGIAVNIAPLVGHGALRIVVLQIVALVEKHHVPAL